MRLAPMIAAVPFNMATQVSRILKIAGELETSREIPATYREALEIRLAIAFGSFKRRPRQRIPRTPKEKRHHYQQKKAQKIYLDVLEMDSYIFIPFILAISPRACETFDILGFRRQHKNLERIHITNKHFLDEIAVAVGIDQVTDYKRLAERLFRAPTPPPPTTVAESDEHFVFQMSKLENIRDCFGDRICAAIKTPGRQVQNEDQRLTECISARIPRQAYQDCIFSIEIGCAREFRDILFPTKISRSQRLGYEGGK